MRGNADGYAMREWGCVHDLIVITRMNAISNGSPSES